MAKDKEKSWWESGARDKVPKLTDEMIIKNKEKVKKQKEGSKEGKLFWEKNKK